LRAAANLWLGLLLALLSGPLAAVPFLPDSDDEVLERLPMKPTAPAMREIKDLRSKLQGDPQNLDLAIRLSRRYFDQAGAQGDPRYVGYAQAALKPWWDLPQPPVRVLVQRATLLQYRHDFAGALADIDRALRRDPADARAWALRAAIHLVQADYDESRRDCGRLSAFVSELSASGCLAFIDGLTGHALESHDRLNAALAHAHDVDPEQKLWILVRLAEMQWRLNNARQADEYFKRALALDITDGFLLAAYSDFLLDYGRPQEVIGLLKNWVAADPLLLRLALAEQAIGNRDAAEHQATLADRYAAARLRGDTTHEQEESRFTLHMLKNAEQALRLAQSNWRVQREPRDARVLLEAALALRQPQPAEPVVEWMARSRIEDWYLQRLADQLRKP
jgi:tetratricopeptide (TPR) repeat protein